MMKKYVCLALTLIMCFSLFIPTVAAAKDYSGDASQNYSVKEYDILVSLKQEKEDLMSNIPSTVSIDEEAQEYYNELANFNPEKAIMEVAALPYEILERRGYTPDQIEILKAYDGGPIEENPQLARSLGELWATILRRSYSNHSAKARFSWDWTTPPIIKGIFDDIVSCAWRGVSEDNKESMMTFVPSSSECKITYYTDMGTIAAEDVEFEIDCKDPNRNAEVLFPLSYDYGYPKEGDFDVCIEEEVRLNELETATFIFAYGHTNFTLTPSINVSGSGPSLGLSCGFGTDEMFNEWMKINADGSTEVSYT